MSSRLMTMTPIAPAASAAAPLSTNVQTPRWMTAIEFGRQRAVVGRDAAQVLVTVAQRGPVAGCR